MKWQILLFSLSTHGKAPDYRQGRTLGCAKRQRQEFALLYCSLFLPASKPAAHPIHIPMNFDSFHMFRRFPCSSVSRSSTISSSETLLGTGPPVHNSLHNISLTGGCQNSRSRSRLGSSVVVGLWLTWRQLLNCQIVRGSFVNQPPNQDHGGPSLRASCDGRATSPSGKQRGARGR